MPQVSILRLGVMNASSIKITVEIGTAGIDIKSSPLAEAFLRIIQERMQEKVTPEFVTCCLYMAAKSLPATPRRKRKRTSADTPTVSAKPEGLSNEK